MLDFDDEIVAGACITHDGGVLHPVTRRTLGLDGPPDPPGTELAP